MAAGIVAAQIAEIAEHAPNTDQHDSPGSDAGPSPSSTSSGPEPALGTVCRVRRKPIPRKGHTKSRRGCFNCKRRKVKCQETLPACAHCTRIGLVCQYPDSVPASSLPVSSLSLAATEWPSPSLGSMSSPSAALQSTPTLFTGNDMLFFHHFLVTAYPPLPIRGDDIWKNVAALSHHVGSLAEHVLTGRS